MAFGLFDGIGKGLEYDKQVFEAFAAAVRHMDTAALSDLAHIAETHAKEITSALGNPLGAVLGGDPFAASRHAFQQFQAKHQTQQARAAKK